MNVVRDRGLMKIFGIYKKSICLLELTFNHNYTAAMFVIYER